MDRNLDETGPSPAPAPGSITAPFAALGLAAAWLISDYFALGYGMGEGASRGAILLSTPLLLALLGRALERPGVARSGLRTALVLALGAVSGALGVAALLSLAVFRRTMHVQVEALGTALVLLPLLALLAWSGRRTSRARPGSLLAAVDTRAPWTIVAAVVGVAPLAVGESTALRYFASSAYATAALAGLALVVVVVSAALDLVDLARATQLARRGERLVPRSEGSPTCEHVDDFGLGDEEREELDARTSGYRQASRPVRVVLGSETQVLPLLRRSAWMSVGLAVGTSVILTLAFHRRGEVLVLSDAGPQPSALPRSR